MFAIAITLLVLEIAVPHVEHRAELWHALGMEWPSYFGFAVSFITIGVMWMNHHEMFRDIERVDQTLQVLNLLLLMCISFLPFPTAVLADNLRKPDTRLVAVLFYGGTFTTIAVFFNALWIYASTNRRLIDTHISDVRLRSRRVRYLFGPISYGITLPLALITPWLSLAIYAGLGIFYLLPLRDVQEALFDGN